MYYKKNTWVRDLLGLHNGLENEIWRQIALQTIELSQTPFYEDSFYF